MNSVISLKTFDSFSEENLEHAERSIVGYFCLRVLPLLLGITTLCSAQEPKLDLSLAIPVGALLCKVAPLSSADSVLRLATVLHVVDGRPLIDERDLLAGFDSAGAPVYLTILPTQTPDQNNAELFPLVFRFGGGSVIGYRVHPNPANSSVVDSAAMPDSAKLSRQLELLPESSRIGAWKLATWLWDHRCGKT